MRYQGKMYRPWPEANSVLIQATLGCSNNQCTFCSMFDDKRFKMRALDDVLADIENLRRYYHHVESVFITDGNVLGIRSEKLLAILNKITEIFSECQHIALYGTMNDFRRKSEADLKAFKQAGLSLVYSGLESGDEQVLLDINKGMTAQQVREGMAKAKAAGIPVLLSFIFGLGGRYRSQAHIEATTALLNEVQPEQIAPMALAVQPGSVLEGQVARGEFVLATPKQVLEEEQYLLANLADFPMFYWGDHGNNVLSLKGWLPENRATFQAQLTDALAHHPVIHQQLLTTHPW